MKRYILGILLVLGFIVAPFWPAVAGVAVTSDEELMAVSAGASEGGAAAAMSGPLNNNGSIQLAGGAQSGASALSLYDASVSNVNIQQSIASLNNVQDVSALAINNQSALNNSSASNDVVNNLKARGQINGQASTQLGAGAQSSVRVLSLLDATSSAANIYQKLTSVDKAQDVSLATINIQQVSNTGKEKQRVTNYKAVSAQTNANAAVQVAGSAQESTSALSLANVADSAVSVFQNIAAFTNSKDIKAIQENDQDPINIGTDRQKISNKEMVAGQINDNGSVQVAGSQQGIHALLLGNAAVSVLNMGQNIAYGGGVNGFYVDQNNLQAATNSVDTTQKVNNRRYVWGQTNNNGSVALSNIGGPAIKVLTTVNVADSAANVGQNIAAGTLGSSTGVGVDFTQRSTQTASNGPVLDDVGTVDPVQKVENRHKVNGQANNSASVLLTDNAQSGSKSLITLNAASSAVNTSQNMAYLNGKGGFAGVDQLSGQTAANDTSQGQIVKNGRNATSQDDNLTSVRITGSQQGASALLLTNAANSAVNAGQNIASIQNSNTPARQRNEQSSTASVESMQATQNLGNVRNQNNNNGSVEIVGSQNNVRMLSLANLAGSAANIGQNVINLNGSWASIKQINKQNAVGSNTDSQYIDNSGNTNHQANNNDSVRLTGAGSQNSSSAVSIVNAAASAVNVGQNIAKATTGDSAGLKQINDQSSQSTVAEIQSVANRDDVGYQSSNTASVQAFDSQAGAKALSLANLAASAANVGQNLASVQAARADLEQINKQGRVAVTSGSGQPAVVNVEDAVNQNNNVGSVQVSSSQNAASGLSLLNGALSSANVGQNLASVNSTRGKMEQANVQKAQLATQFWQTVTNMDDAHQQNNNNMSVQLIGSQNSAKALSLANLSSSAANIGQNVASLTGTNSAKAEQTNDQIAWPYTVAYQAAIYGDDVKNQNNNDVSVQLNGSQNNVSALSLLNLAASAANIGQNILSVSAPKVEATQSNRQTATAATGGAEQRVANEGPVTNQFNNNASLQLTGSQNNVSALSIVNAAFSAVNVGQNIISATGQDVTVSQINCQTASGGTDNSQTTSGYGATKSQNSNNAVVLNGSQMNTHGLVIANVAGSAVNFAQNIAYLSNARGAALTQINFQKSY